MQSLSELGEASEDEVQRDPRASRSSLIEEAQVDPRKHSDSSSAERFLEHSHSPMDRLSGHYLEMDFGRSCDYKVGSPSYLDKISWREGKPQNYSEPRLILDLSHWKHNTHSCTRERDAEQIHDEEPDDLFQEISNWAESTQLGLYSPSSPQQPSTPPSSPPLPVSPSMLPHSLRHTQTPLLVQHPSRRSPASFYSSPPTLLPSSPSSPSPHSSPPFQSSRRVSPSSTAAEEHSRFDLDVFISQALRLCSQSEESEASEHGNTDCISVVQEHKLSRTHSSTPEVHQAPAYHKAHW